MQTPRLGVLPGLLAALVLTTAASGCKKDGADGKTDGKAAADGKAEESRSPDPEPEGTGSEGGSGEAAAQGSGGSGGSGGAGSSGGAGGEPAAASTGGAEDEGGSTGGAEGESGSTGGAPDPAALLKELAKKRTKDARAVEIVAELEAAGVETNELAKALTARGKALFAAPDRAKALFEQALEKDPKIPDPAFELAKQAAVLGELDEAKKWLTIVKERKGKKLLKQIEFDPMWEILKDDPDVRALLK